ncbi:methyltransferase [Pontibacillus chungwhensis BH030062]|uniref:Methyltransferase n=1 Tax=Pontibacillus chungwhensis BH030062 TaxID=1385513 RepID=A0A0A2URL7_9BACI|nr:class I SAM-dependent methyltransferase [Pontibacillus chungwhensis]KGP90589.1 methyltransferase [Pontibacillus chungwhensis BH030062]
MAYKGSNVYDQESFFNQFMARRNRETSPNNTMESPVINDLIDSVPGKRILDLGCGDGSFGLTLIQQECSFYEGVDPSLNMVEKAGNRLPEDYSAIHLSSMEDWEFKDQQYDVVVSRMALHYVADLSPVMKNIFHSLRNGGQFLCSIQHPVLTSSVECAALSGKRSNWVVDDYFNQGERQEQWMDEQVIKYHRTTETYFQLLKEVGFTIENLKECEPQINYFPNEEEYNRRKRIPLFLVFSCRK